MRYVDAAGIIRTIAGTGTLGFSGDGGPPRQAQFNQTFMLGISPDRRLHIVDNGNQRVRVIGSTLPSFTASNIDIPSEDGGELYRFDEFGRHLTTLDTFTGAALYTFGYDADGQLASITDAHGNVTKITRAASGAPTAIVAPFGQKTTLTTDANGSLASVRDPAGGTWTLASKPDGQGLLASVTDPLGHTDTFTYDDNGRLMQNQGADAASVDLARTEIPAGYFVTETNALGHTGKFQVEDLASGDELRTNTDAANLVSTERRGEDGSLKITDADATIDTTMRGGDPRFGLRAPIDKTHTFVTPGGKTLSESAARAVTLSDPLDPLSLTAYTETFTRNGRTSTAAYDPVTRTFDLATPLGRHATTTLNATGEPVAFTFPGVAPAALSYDAHGRLTSATAGAGVETRSMSATYNAAGLVATATDSLVRKTALTYNAAGDVTQLTLPGQRVVKFTRDARGRAVSITPPGRTAHQLAYTEFGAVASYTAPDAGGGAPVTAFAYRADRQLLKITRSGGATVAFGYDTAGRLLTRTIAAGATMLSYHPVTGNLASITAPGGNALAFPYDGSEPLGTTWSGEVSGSVSRTIDNDLRTATQSVNGANPITFTYDDDGDLIAAGDLTLTRVAQTGFITAAAIGGISESYGYNAFGETTSRHVEFGGTTIFDPQLTRDALARITRNVETNGGATTTIDYSYDAAGRLAQVSRTGAAPVAFTYDANGNRTSADGAAATFDAQDRLTLFDNRASTYNAAGDLLTKGLAAGSLALTYDAMGNLTQAITPGAQVDYLVDAGNRRIGRKIGGTLVQGFLYDSALRIVAELDGASALVSRFVHATRANVPDFMIKGGTTYRLVTDPNGSVRLVLNAADGSVAQRLDYDAFGNVLPTSTNPGFQPFGFAGGLYDPETKLVRFGARDYNADTGRWTTKDPALFDGGDTNLYAYVGNDPVNTIDPSGNFVGCVGDPHGPPKKRSGHDRKVERQLKREFRQIDEDAHRERKAREAELENQLRKLKSEPGYNPYTFQERSIYNELHDISNAERAYENSRSGGHGSIVVFSLGSGFGFGPEVNAFR